MKTVGLIGGMSWESTGHYYRLINNGVAARLGGLHSAKIVIASIDFHELHELQLAGRWDDAGRLLVREAQALERAGAGALLIGANTMHKVAPAVAAAVSIPLLHIADVTADAIVRSGFRRPALLGTRFTMEEDFLRQRLAARHPLEVLVPPAEDRATIHRVIYEELCRGRFLASSREAFQAIIGRLAAAGADCVILGCTEIPLLIAAGDSVLPPFDTTALHAAAAVEWALG